MAFIDLFKDLINFISDPRVLITLTTVALFASLKWPAKFYSDKSAKVLFTIMFVFFLVSLADADFRLVVTKPDNVPIVGMVSYSLIFRRGPAAFVDAARKSGLCGLVVPDLVADEADELAAICKQADCKLILLVTPTTTPERAAKIVSLCSGFVYCVSVVGITGERDRLPADLTQQLARLRTMTNLPLCVGFGVSRPEHVRHLKEIADGVIVGSALIKKLEQGGPEAVVATVRELSAALH